MVNYPATCMLSCLNSLIEAWFRICSFELYTHLETKHK